MKKHLSNSGYLKAQPVRKAGRYGLQKNRDQLQHQEDMEKDLSEGQCGFSDVDLKYYQIRIENKVGKVTPVTHWMCNFVFRILITLFRFINWPNRNINGEIELANL